MRILVDTSIWSLALRRNHVSDEPTVTFLRQSLWQGAYVATTGLILQELLQGVSGPKDRNSILMRLGVLPLILPSREDHIAAADLRNACRRRGVQIDTVDVLLAQLCITHDLTLLTTDQDFTHLARHAPLRIWRAATPDSRP